MKSGYFTVVVWVSGLGLLGLSIVFCGCAAPFLSPVLAFEEIGSGIQSVSERRAGPLAESEWNRARIWYRIDEDPATYLPVGYSKHQSRGESEGVWVVDERDGKRFFIPAVGVEGYKRNLLFAEATKVTNWSPKPRVGFKRLKDTPSILIFPQDAED